MVTKSRPWTDYYFTAPSWDLTALYQLHELVDENIEDLVAARSPSRTSEHPGESAVAHMHQIMLNQMLRNTIRAPIYLSGWAVYESAVAGIAEHFRQRLAIPFALTDRNGAGDFLARSARYFSEHLGFTLTPSGEQEAELRRLYRLRNLLVHAGGTRAGARAKDWEKARLEFASRRGIDFSGERIALDGKFLKEALMIFYTAVEHVTVEARNELIRRGVTSATTDDFPASLATRVHLQVQLPPS
ncbi:MAG: hypothetical protein JWM27_4835 [Gemmatimonadetes bacterium]|nr:hypothetical protein [Gemmatimonadota bacterium]